MSWALQAIEKEAEARATRNLLQMGVFNTILGLNAKDMLLKMFYESRTGRRAEDIQKESEFVKG